MLGNFKRRKSNNTFSLNQYVMKTNSLITQKKGSTALMNGKVSCLTTIIYKKIVDQLRAKEPKKLIS